MFLFNLALKKHKLTGDTSVMTYRGHGVLHTLIRCRFSPEFSTGQRFIYSGCSTGKIVSECLRVRGDMFLVLPVLMGSNSFFNYIRAGPRRRPQVASLQPPWTCRQLDCRLTERP